MSSAPTTSTFTASHPRRHDAGHVTSIIVGSLSGLIALAFLLAGLTLVWAHSTQRDDDGFYSSGVVRLSTPTAAITSESLDLGDFNDAGSDWAIDRLDARVRLTATRADGGPVFVGIARAADLDRYLAGIPHDQVSDLSPHAGMGDHMTMNGQFGRGGFWSYGSGAVKAAPAPTQQSFWVAKSTGNGTRTVNWKPSSGRWAAVVMNANGAPSVLAGVSAGAKTSLLLPIGAALLAAALVLALLTAGLFTYGLRGKPHPAGSVHTGSGPADPDLAAVATGVPTTSTTAGEARTAEAAGPAPTFVKADTAAETAGAATDVVASPYPVQVEAELDATLNRWLWLVKWFLAIPHFIVLTFLWAAFAVLTVIAWFAILFTGRYPRGIFDFNVGVLRWHWRVGYYATTAIGTDRYPPFTLAAVPDYPAHLEIPYPEHLSRGKALVKTWLLAIPHYLIIGALVGGWGPTATEGNVNVSAPGLLPILVIVAGVVLAVTGRYPREVFRLIIGVNRWFYRVVAYAALMRDEYPPFRLDR